MAHSVFIWSAPEPDAAPEPDVELPLLAEAIAASLAKLKRVLSNTEVAEVAIGELDERVTTFGSRALTLVKHARKHADADVKLMQQRLEKREGEFRDAQEHATADLIKAQQNIAKIESEREMMRWEHVEATVKAQEHAKKEADSLLAAVEAKADALITLEDTAR